MIYLYKLVKSLMTYWINGKESLTIAVNDRAVHFGDGCFTTLKVVKRKAVFLSQHITRLQQDSARLHLPQPDWVELIQQVKEIAQQHVEAVVLKIIISRGQGGRGYSSQNFHTPTVIISLNSYPTHYAQLQLSGVCLSISQVPISKNPFLAGIKHLNRLEQVLIKQDIDAQNVDEALVLDTDGQLIECCSANIFWRQGEQVFTPSLTHSGVNGLMRKHIIEQLADSSYTLSEVERYPQVLANCDEVMISNSLMPILPVNRIRIEAGQAEWGYQSRSLFNYLLPLCQ